MSCTMYVCVLFLCFFSFFLLCRWFCFASYFRFAFSIIFGRKSRFYVWSPHKLLQCMERVVILCCCSGQSNYYCWCCWCSFLSGWDTHVRIPLHTRSRESKFGRVHGTIDDEFAKRTEWRILEIYLFVFRRNVAYPKKYRRQVIYIHKNAKQQNLEMWMDLCC